MIEDTDRVNRWYKVQVDGLMGSMLHFKLDWGRLHLSVWSYRHPFTGVRVPGTGTVMPTYCRYVEITSLYLCKGL